MKYCIINGKETDQINAYDKGFAFGDGIFTTAKISQGQTIHLEKHIERLKFGCERLFISPIDFDSLHKKIKSVSASYSIGVLKIIISAGVGGRGYSRLNCTPTIAIYISDFPTHYSHWQTEGISLGLATTQLGINPQLAGIKHLNRLEQVLIKRELEQSPFDDLLVLNYQQQVIETSCANIFWFKQNQLYTSALTQSGINGIIRQQILQMNPKCQIIDAKLSDLEQADSMFICNSLMGIVPVCMFLENKLSMPDYHLMSEFNHG